MLPHPDVHRGGDQHRLVGREQQRGREVVGDPRRHLRQQIRGRRSDERPRRRRGDSWICPISALVLEVPQRGVDLLSASAASVIGVTKCAPPAVSTGSPMPAFRDSRISSHALYAAMPPPTMSRMRSSRVLRRGARLLEKVAQSVRDEGQADQREGLPSSPNRRCRPARTGPPSAGNAKVISEPRVASRPSRRPAERATASGAAQPLLSAAGGARPLRRGFGSRSRSPASRSSRATRVGRQNHGAQRLGHARAAQRQAVPGRSPTRLLSRRRRQSQASAANATISGRLAHDEQRRRARGDRAGRSDYCGRSGERQARSAAQPNSRGTGRRPRCTNANNPPASSTIAATSRRGRHATRAHRKPQATSTAAASDRAAVPDRTVGPTVALTTASVGRRKVTKGRSG